MKKLSSILLLGLSAANVDASLIDRGGGLLYDNVLNVTWLQDVTYGQRSEQGGISTIQPFADAPTAQSWVDNLVYHDSVRDVDYSDWRLPRMLPVNGTQYDLWVTLDGSTDYGINNGSTQTELGYMYYQNLGLKAFFSSTNQYQTDWGPAKGAEPLPLMDVGPVRNLFTGDGYLASTTDPDPSFAYGLMSFRAGAQTIDNATEINVIAWAVRDGDVAGSLLTLNGPAPIPLPAPFALLLSALLSLGSHRYFRNSKEAA